MKKRLIALVITTSLVLGGVGTTVTHAIDYNESVVIAANNELESNTDNNENGTSNIVNEEINEESEELTIENVGVIEYFRCGFSKIVDNIKEFFANIFNWNSNESVDDNTESAGDDSNTEDLEDTTENKEETNIDNTIDDNIVNDEVVQENQNTNQEQNTVTEVPSSPISKPSNNETSVNTGNSSGNTSTSTGNVENSSENFMAQVEQLIYTKVNEQRANNGVNALSYNTTMQKYARIKSQDMGDNNYFDHKDLNGNLITVKMKNDGVNYSAWGENIAYISGISDANALAEKFMTNWMNSQGHRENILSNNFSSIGIGVYKVGNKVYATQEFYR